MPDLTSTLNQLLYNARHNPGSRIFADLPRGLRLHARVRGGSFTLACSRRAPAKPSQREWEIVLAHLPQALPDNGPPVISEAGGRWYTGSTWPVDELIKIGGA